MTLPYVVVGEDPAVGFWAGDRPAGIPDLAYQRLLRLPIWRSPVYLTGGAENANGSVMLDNGDGLLSSLWEVPPIRQPLQIWEGGEVIIEGIVVGLEVGTDIVLEFEA